MKNDPITKLAQALRGLDGGSAFAQTLLTEIECEVAFDDASPARVPSSLATLRLDERHAAEQLMAALEDDGRGWCVEVNHRAGCDIGMVANRSDVRTHDIYSAVVCYGRRGDFLTTGHGASPMAAVHDLLTKLPERCKATAPVAPQLRSIAGAISALAPRRLSSTKSRRPLALAS